MRLVFWGTPLFAVPALRLLAASQHDVAAVVTNPDRPRGRGRQLASTAVKEAAVEMGLPVLQPESLAAPELADRLRALVPDLLCVVAFSILPAELLAVPRLGAINLHPSLLPKYRGAAPIVWALVRGETRTGLTTFLLNPAVDAGDILLQQPVEIDPDETAGELETRLAELGARLVLDTVDGLAAGTITPRPQPRGQATRAPRLCKEDARIDWTRPAAAVRNLVRGMNPVPGAFTTWRGTLLKVHRAAIMAPTVPPAPSAMSAAGGAERQPAGAGGTAVAPVPADLGSPGMAAAELPPAPGTVVRASPATGLVVATGCGCLRLTHVQPAGRSAMTDSEFLRGHAVRVGERLGDDG